MNKSQLLTYLQTEYHNWQALLDEIGPSRMETPGVNGAWSFKDMLGHLLGWQGVMVADLAAAARGVAGPPRPWPADLAGDDAINAWIYEAYRQRSLDDLLAETEQRHEQLLAILAGLPDDVRIEHREPSFYLVYVAGKRFEAGEFFNHFHDDHEPDVRAWLGRAATD